MRNSLRDRQILSIALPSIISNITVPLLGLVDVAITGHMPGNASVGAIAVGGTLFNILYWMFAFLRMGTSGETAQARGRRDFHHVHEILRQGFVLSMTISLLLLLTSPLVSQCAFYLLRLGHEVRQLATTYFNICIFGAPASLGLFVFSGWYIGMQNSRIPMMIAVGQNLVNIILSLLLVYWFGMGISGIALGTVIAQWAGFAIAAVLYFIHYRQPIRRLSAYSVHHPVTRRHFRVAFSSFLLFLRTLCLIIVHFMFIAAGTSQGDEALAANTLIMQMFTLYSYFMDGFANAGEALAGKAVGSGSQATYSSVVRHLFAWGGAVALLFTILYASSGQFLMRLLTDNAAIIATIHTYRYWMMLIPFAGMAAFVWDGIYIGATRTAYMLLSMLVSTSLFITGYFLLIPHWHNHGLWASFIAYLLMRGIVLTIGHNRRT